MHHRSSLQIKSYLSLAPPSATIITISVKFTRTASAVSYAIKMRNEKDQFALIWPQLDLWSAFVSITNGNELIKGRTRGNWFVSALSQKTFLVQKDPTRRDSPGCNKISNSDSQLLKRDGEVPIKGELHKKSSIESWIKLSWHMPKPIMRKLLFKKIIAAKKESPTLNNKNTIQF